MNPIETAKMDLTWTKTRMMELLAATPEDKLNFKPSPTGRSIIEIVAHAAHALENIAMQLGGTAFPIPNSNEANEVFKKHDAAFKTREAVRAYLQEKFDHYISVIERFTEEDLTRMAPLPFGLGEAPIGYYMTMGNAHTLGHVAQIEYVQTIYGDKDWHTGF
jgi:uncharacterized damage-inducible protein DinB